MPDLQASTDGPTVVIVADEAAAPRVEEATEAKGRRSGGSGASARFFVRGVASLGEHHLQDHFEQFGNVEEVTLVRDKKTQKPRGMAFVTLTPRAAEEGAALPDI